MFIRVHILGYNFLESFVSVGTESETKAFMVICIETVEKCSQNDVRTPVFIFERLCSIIYPEENEIGEFYLSLEKDPQQEDFLQVCFNSKYLSDLFQLFILVSK